MRKIFPILLMILSLATADCVAGEYPSVSLPNGYAAELIRVIDGDSIQVRVRIWIDQDVITTVRLQGLDTAELRSHCAREQELAVAAKTRLDDLVRGQKLELYDVQRDKYGGRVIAKLRTKDHNDLAELLIQENLGRRYAGEKRQSWCNKQLSQAQYNNQYK